MLKIFLMGVFKTGLEKTQHTQGILYIVHIARCHSYGNVETLLTVIQLTFFTLWAFSTDDNLMMFFLFTKKKKKKKTGFDISCKLSL